MKNKFFTNEPVRFANIVQTPKFADIGNMEITMKVKDFHSMDGHAACQAAG